MIARAKEPDAIAAAMRQRPPASGLPLMNKELKPKTKPHPVVSRHKMTMVPGSAVLKAVLFESGIFLGE